MRWLEDRRQRGVSAACLSRELANFGPPGPPNLRPQLTRHLRLRLSLVGVPRQRLLRSEPLISRASGTIDALRLPEERPGSGDPYTASICRDGTEPRGLREPLNAWGRVEASIEGHDPIDSVPSHHGGVKGVARGIAQHDVLRGLGILAIDREHFAATPSTVSKAGWTMSRRAIDA